MARALERAGDEIRRRSSESATSASASDGIKALASAIGYARTVARGRSRRRFAWDEAYARATRFVVRDGRVETARRREDEGGNERSRVATGILSREDAWAYHNRLIDRQHFGRRLKKFIPEPL